MSISKISHNYFTNPIKCITHKIRPLFHGHRLSPISVLVAGVCLCTLAIYILKNSPKAPEPKQDDNDKGEGQNSHPGQSSLHSKSHKQPSPNPQPAQPLVSSKKEKVPIPSPHNPSANAFQAQIGESLNPPMPDLNINLQPNPKIQSSPSLPPSNRKAQSLHLQQKFLSHINSKGFDFISSDWKSCRLYFGRLSNTYCLQVGPAPQVAKFTYSNGEIAFLEPSQQLELTEELAVQLVREAQFAFQMFYSGLEPDFTKMSPPFPGKTPLIITDYNVDKLNLIIHQLRTHNPLNNDKRTYILSHNGHNYKVRANFSGIEISDGQQVMQISASLSAKRRCIKMTHPHICPALLDQLQTELQQLGLCKLDPANVLWSNKIHHDRYVSINKCVAYLVEDGNIYKATAGIVACIIGLVQSENSPLITLNYDFNYRVTSIEFTGDPASPLYKFYLRLLEQRKAVEGYRQPELTGDDKQLYFEVIRNSLTQAYQFFYLDKKYTASIQNGKLLIQSGYNFQKLWSNDPTENPWVDNLNIEWLVARVYDHISLLQKYNEICKTIARRLFYRMYNSKEPVSFVAFNKQFTACIVKKVLHFTWTSAGYKKTIAFDTSNNNWLECWLQRCEEGLAVDNMLDLPFILEKHLNECNLSVLDIAIRKHSYQTHDKNKRCLVHELQEASEEYPLLFADEERKLYKGWYNQSLKHFYIRSEADPDLCLTLVLDDNRAILQADLSQSNDAFVKRGLFQQHYQLRLELDHNIPLNNREIEHYYKHISPYLKAGKDSACLIPCPSLNIALLAWMDEKTLCVQTATQGDDDKEEYWFRLTPVNDTYTWFTDCNPALEYENRRLLILADAIKDAPNLNYLSDAPSAPLIEQKDVLISKEETIECYNTFIENLDLFTGTTPYCFNHEGQCLAAWINQTAGMINIQKLEDFHKNNNNNKLGIRGINNNIDGLRVNGLHTQQVRHMDDYSLWLITLRNCVNAGTPSLDPQQPATFQFKPANWQALHAQAQHGIDIENIDIDDSTRKYHVWVGKDQNCPVIYIQPKDELNTDNKLMAGSLTPAQKGKIAICLDNTFKIHEVSIEGKRNENVIPTGWIWKIKSLFRSTMLMEGDYRADGDEGWSHYNSSTLHIQVLRDSMVFYPDYHLNQLNQLWENRRLSVKFKSLNGELESSIDAGGPTKGYLNLLYSSLCHYSALGFHAIQPSILVPQTAEKLHESVLGKLAMLNPEESNLYKHLGKFLQNCFRHRKLAGHQLARGVFRALVAIKTSKVADEQERILMVAEALLQGHKDAGMNVDFLIEKITQYRQIKNAGDDWWNTNCLEKGVAVPFKTVLEQIAATDFFPMALLTDDFTLDWDKAKKDKALVLDAMLDFIFRIYGDHGQLGRQILPLLEMAEGIEVSLENYAQFYSTVQGALNSPKLIAEAITAHQSSASADIQERINWLKSAVLHRWNPEQIQKFVLWITDASNLPANGKITVRKSQQIFAHTCFSLLDLPVLPNQSEDDFIKMIECEMVMSSYSAG